jgi:hypothetical protein
VSGESGPNAAGGDDAARLAREVQDLGFQAARTIVERFIEIFSQFATSTGGAGTPRDVSGTSHKGSTSPRGGGPGFGFSQSDRSPRALQSDMQRATDAYLAILSQLNEAGLRFFEAFRWSGPAATEAEQDDLRLPDVAPGGRASARLWLHNTTTSAAVDLRPWCPGLASHRGASLPPTAVTCAPARIDRLDPGASCEILVTVAVGEDASQGSYHGQLLVDGLPDAVFPLRTRVRSTTKPS